MADRIKPGARLVLVLGTVLVAATAMVFDTKVVKIGSDADVRSDVFSPAKFGGSDFPKVQASVEKRATDAAVLAVALSKDAGEAATKYGVMAEAGPELPVKFTGKAGQQDSGVYEVAVTGIPDTIHVSVQTGPAITGTDLRDATGTITFGQFQNQIEYQNAGSALNKEMKKDVLAKVDTSNLTGKTIAVVGVFQMTDPTAWLVTPVKLDVQ